MKKWENLTKFVDGLSHTLILALLGFGAVVMIVKPWERTDAYIAKLDAARLDIRSEAVKAYVNKSYTYTSSLHDAYKSNAKKEEKAAYEDSYGDYRNAENAVEVYFLYGEETANDPVTENELKTALKVARKANKVLHDAYGDINYALRNSSDLKGDGDRVILKNKIEKWTWLKKEVRDELKDIPEGSALNAWREKWDGVFQDLRDGDHDLSDEDLKVTVTRNYLKAKHNEVSKSAQKLLVPKPTTSWFWALGAWAGACLIGGLVVFRHWWIATRTDSNAEAPKEPMDKVGLGLCLVGLGLCANATSGGNDDAQSENKAA